MNDTRISDVLVSQRNTFPSLVADTPSSPLPLTSKELRCRVGLKNRNNRETMAYLARLFVNCGKSKIRTLECTLKMPRIILEADSFLKTKAAGC